MREPSPPVLEMLWEQDPPGDVLRERFGFATADDAATWVREQLLRRWGIVADACERIVMSDANALAWVGAGGGRLLLKWSVDARKHGRLRALAEVLDWLEASDVPISALVPAPAGDRQLEFDGVSAGLQREVEGAPLDVASEPQVRATGSALARLQLSLRAFPSASDGDAFGGAPAPLAARLASWVERAAPHLDPRALVVLRRSEELPALEAPPQLVHGDVRAANVLCAQDRVAAFIDFEELRVDHRVVDLARAAVLLGTRYHDWEPVPPSVHAALLSGYEAVAPLTEAERRWWPVLLLWVTLGFIPDGVDESPWKRSADGLLSQVEAGLLVDAVESRGGQGRHRSRSLPGEDPLRPAADAPWG